MNATAKLLTPNAVARRQVYLDWAERAERARRRRGIRRKVLVVGIPFALLIGATVLTLDDGRGRLEPRADVGVPVAEAPIPVPSAMTAQVPPVERPPAAIAPAVRIAAAPTVRPAPRPLRATGRSGPASLNADAAGFGSGSAGLEEGESEDAVEAVAAIPARQRDRLAALDAIRDLRLR